MQLNDILRPERITTGLIEESKKRVLEHISALMCADLANADNTEVFEAYVARERLGSTAIGHGVAIPHIRSAFTSEPMGAFIQLQKGIDFGAADGSPVDLIFALLVPTEACENHLQILASLAEMFSHPHMRDALRDAKNASDLLTTLNDYHESKRNQSAA